MGFADLIQIVDNSQRVKRVKKDTSDKKSCSRKMSARKHDNEWVTNLKLNKNDFDTVPPMTPIFSAKIGNLPRLKRRGSPDSVMTNLSLFSTSSLGSAGLVSGKKGHQRARMTRHLDWDTFVKARHILLDEMLDSDEVDQDTDSFLRQRKEMSQKAHYETDLTSHDRSPERLCESPPTIVVDKSCLSPVKEVLSDADSHSIADDVSLPELNQSRNPTPALSGQDRASTCRFLSSISPTSMAFSSPCPSLKLDKAGVPDFERHVSLKVRQRILMTTHELNRITGYGDPDNLYIADADGDWLRFTDEDYSKIPRIPQRFRIAPQLSRVIRKDIRYKTGRPCYRELKERDIRAFEREKSKDMEEGTFKELCIFHWLVDIDEDSLDDIPTDVIIDEPKRRQSYSRHNQDFKSNKEYASKYCKEIFDVGIPM